jgi:hypothetical protein
MLGTCARFAAALLLFSCAIPYALRVGVAHNFPATFARLLPRKYTAITKYGI